jgi:hypothetical protein
LKGKTGRKTVIEWRSAELQKSKTNGYNAIWRDYK